MDNNAFLRQNWAQLLFVCTFLFSLGGAYTEFQSMKAKNQALQEKIEEYNATLHRRVSATNDDLDDLQKEVFQMREDVSYTKGYVDADKGSQ